MTLPSATNVYDELFTRVAFKVVGSPGYKDLFYKGRPLLRAIHERKLSWSGSKQIAHRVNLGNTAQGGSYAKADTLNINDVVNETWAVYDPRFYIEPIVIFFQDRIKAGNLAGVQSIVETRMSDAGERQQDQLLLHLCRSTATLSTDLEPLLTYVKSSGAAGGLNPATAGQSTWAAQNTDTVDFSAAGVNKIRQETLNATKGGKTMTDLIVLPQTFFQEALEAGDGKVQFNKDVSTRAGTQFADLGMMGLSIVNTPVIWDTQWTTNQSATILGLNFDGIHMVTHDTYDGSIEPFESALTGRMDASVGWRRFVGQLTLSDRDIQYSLTTVS